jgi:hypothetical protein
MPEDWIDQETGQFLEEPIWMASSRTCYGCVEKERMNEFVKGRGQTVELVPFQEVDPDTIWVEEEEEPEPDP